MCKHSTLFIVLMTVFLLLLPSCTSSLTELADIEDGVYVTGKIQEVSVATGTLTIVGNEKGYYVLRDVYAVYAGKNVMILGKVTKQTDYGRFLQVMRFKCI